MAIHADYRRRAHTICDFCEKRVYQHVCIAARRMHYGESDPNRGWGFFEGHQRCARLERIKARRPWLFGAITRYGYR